ncbi:MAG: sensor histidine kinase [Flavobacteriales bacterium]|nr:sensor histidine kinase [Flavobacteriales bacterium]
MPRPATAHHRTSAARRACTVALMLLAIAGTHARSPAIDSLRRTIAAGGADSTLVRARLALCMELRHTGDTAYAPLLDSTIAHADRARMRPEQVLALLEKGQFMVARGATAAAMDQYQQAEALARRHGLQRQQGYALFHIAETHRARAEHSTALEMYGRALPIFTGLGMDAQVATVLFSQGAVLDHLGRAEESLEHFRQAHAIYTQLDDPFGLGLTLNSLGLMHEHLGRHAEALGLFRSALGMMQRSGNRAGAANVLSSIAGAHRQLGHADSARHYMRASLDEREAMGDRSGLGQALVRFSYDQQQMGDMAGAEGSIARALEIFRAIGNRQYEGQAQVRLAQLRHAQGRTREGIAHAEEALAIALGTRSLNEALEARHVLAELHEESGDPAEALRHFKAWSALEDSLRTRESIALLDELHARYETGQKDRRLAEQQLQLAEGQAALERREKVLWGTGIGAAALAVIAALAWRDRRRHARLANERLRRMESEQEAAAAKALLLGEERERQRVAAELHDGIGLLLSAARMRVDTGAPGAREKAGAILAEAAGEVRRISHALMPGTLARLGLPDALRELAAHLTAGGLHVEVHVHGLAQRLPAPLETALYRMVQEALNNTVKHARATSATVDLSVEDGRRLSLVVTDDGQGFDPATGTDGHGLGHVRSRAALLGGDARLRTAPGQGAQWEIDIPLHA